MLLVLSLLALLMFIGLLADLSIMFIRYQSFQQAVDEAAEASAKQVREGNSGDTLRVTAQLHIRLHGFNAEQVWVETCETDIERWKDGYFATLPASDPRYDPTSGTLEEPFVTMVDPETGAEVQQPIMQATELCDWDRLTSMVRVHAQIDSTTTFLRLLGIRAFTLTAVSQTS